MLHEGGGREAGDEGHAHDTAAPGLDPVGAHDAVARVIGPLDEHVGGECLDQLEGSILLEQHHAIDGREPREHPGPRRLAADRPPAALAQPPDGSIAVDPHDQDLALAPGGFEQLDVAGMQQVEHAVGEHDRTGLPGPPGHGLAERPHLRRAAGGRHTPSAGAAPNRALSPGGATKVVTMTMSSTAPNTSSVSTPDRRPMSAKMSPTSPRGTIPTPTTMRRSGTQGAAHPAATLPTIAMRVSAAATTSVPRELGVAGFSRPRLTDAPTLTKKIGVKIEATGRTSCSMVSNWLVPDRMSPAANAPMMSADPDRAASDDSPRANATANTSSTKRTRMRTTTSNSLGTRYRPTSTATTRKATATARVRTTPSTETAAPPATPETTLRMTSPSTSSMTAAPMMTRASDVAMRPRSDSTRAVIPTEVAVRVAPTKMAAVVRSPWPLAGCG